MSAEQGIERSNKESSDSMKEKYWCICGVPYSPAVSGVHGCFSEAENSAKECGRATEHMKSDEEKKAIREKNTAKAAKNAKAEENASYQAGKAAEKETKKKIDAVGKTSSFKALRGILK